MSRYFDPLAFRAPAPYTFGNTARFIGTLRAPGAADLDFSVFKNIPIKERLSVQLRVESFNLFNHPEFGPPNTSIGAATAGVISSQANSPRDVQIALKVIF